MFEKHKKKPTKSFFSRFFRSMISIIILTAFVLGISFFIKEVSKFNTDKAIALTSPLLNRIGVSPQVAGEVAGAFVQRIFQTNIVPSKNHDPDSSSYRPPFMNEVNTNEIKESSSNSNFEPSLEKRNLVLKVAVLADSHNQNERLKSAISLAKQNGANSIFFLGDYTDFGEVGMLTKAKQVMDDNGLTYYSLPGDHDLAASVGSQNFIQVFGEPLHTVTISNIKFVLLDNSANYTLISTARLQEFKKDLEGAKFVLLSQPVYHPFASILSPVMGLVKGKEVPDIKAQAEEILAFVRSSDVVGLISGEQHNYDVKKDPIRDTLSHIYIGSITKDSAPLGRSSFTMLSVFDDGSYDLQEVPLE